MFQFKSTRLAEEDPELSEENVARRILEGGCKDIGVVLSLSQAMSYNIRIDADSVLGVTKIDLSRAETKDRRSNSVFESQQKEGSNSFHAPHSSYSPETPLSMAKRLEMLEMGKREMDEVNDSLLEMLEELDF